jgi:dipeptidyl aminopeptidase/acylaminoacyl peptidase
MNKIISIDNIRRFAYVNDKVCIRPIKGIVISFFGLGGSSMYNTDNDQGVYFGDRGILYVVPYTNPWAWMNKQATAYTDEILDVLFATYGLDENTPIVSTGGSMGGLAALVYTKYAKRTPVACVASCPVCDLPYHFTEREDLPRTLYSAFWNEEGDMDDILARFSPLHLVPEMPRVDYYIFHCEEDKAVNKGMHSDKLVAAMKEGGIAVTYHPVPRMGHCALTVEMRNLYLEYAVKAVEKK